MTPSVVTLIGVYSLNSNFKQPICRDSIYSRANIQVVEHKVFVKYKGNPCNRSANVTLVFPAFSLIRVSDSHLEMIDFSAYSFNSATVILAICQY